MEFSLTEFTRALFDKMYNRFPNLPNRGVNNNGKPKHGEYNDEIRDVAFKQNGTNGVITLTENLQMLEIGNSYAETHYPYYHILENSLVIHKRNKGTAKSKGSQMFETNLSKRDYEQVSMKGKTFSKEYRHNYRGDRGSNVLKSADVIKIRNGITEHSNKNSNTYSNEKHYHYIEKMLDPIVKELKDEFNLTLGKTTTDLKEEAVLDNFNLPDNSMGYDEAMEWVNALIDM